MSSIKNHQSLPVLSHQQQFCAYSTCPLQSCHQRQITSASHGFLIAQHPHRDLCVCSKVDAIRNGVATQDQVQCLQCLAGSPFMYTVNVLKRCCDEGSVTAMSHQQCFMDTTCTEIMPPWGITNYFVSKLRCLRSCRTYRQSWSTYHDENCVAVRDHQSPPSITSNSSCTLWASSEMRVAIKGHQSQPTVSIFAHNEGLEKWHCPSWSPVNAVSYQSSILIDTCNKCEMTQSLEITGSIVMWLINIPFMCTVNVLRHVGSVTARSQYTR